MKKLAGESLNIVEENLAAMQQLFPEAFEEGKIDFDVLRQLLGDYVDDEEERYSFRWNGKGKALRLSQTPSTGTLRPCKEESKDWNTTENLYIEGDNLEVLKLLQKSYHGRVKMIYIDPPYNTGKDFVYKDDFRDNVANYKRITGQVDDEGRSTGTNSESNGRFHTDWLNMMYPRLRLARNLLSDDGVIFISIDDNEVGNLKKICDEVFGESNFVCNFIWEKKKKPSFLNKNIGTKTEYILAYARERHKTIPFSVESTENGKKYPFNNAGNPLTDLKFLPHKVKFNMKDTIIPSQDMSEGNIKTVLLNDVYIINGENVNEFTLRGEFRYSQSTVDEMMINNENIVISKVPFRPNRIMQGGEIKKAHNLLTLSTYNVGTNEDATQEQSYLFGDSYFDYTKPIGLIDFFVKCITYTDSDALILDFFSGSATTAHAVMNLNAEDGGNRRFILVQLPETTPVDSEAHKAGYENICEIGKERIRRAGEKVKAECEDEERAASLDIGFKVFKLDSSNLQKWQPQPEDLFASLQESMDNFLPGRTELDVVYEIALKLGLDLSYEVEEREVDGQNIYIIGAGALMICLASPISTETAEALLKLHEEYAPETWQVVFRDTGFLSDQEKTNIKETLKSAGLDEDAFISI